MKKKNEDVKQKIAQLLGEAQDFFYDDKLAANRKVQEARRLAMKSRTRIPGELKRKFCKHCNSFLMPGINTRIRIHDAKVIILCKECKKFTRIPIK